jgi:tetratricopeptide (TPR) repeat protein
MKRENLFVNTFTAATVLLILLSIPHISFAQDTVVKGIIHDPEGNPVEGAKITFFCADRGLKFTVKSNEEGEFIKAGIVPTVYKVTVEKDGYFTIESMARIRFGYTEELEIKFTKIPPKVEDDKNLDKGIEEYTKGNYDDAIVLFEKVVKKFPTSIEGYYNLGLSYMRKGDLDQALVAFEKARDLNPEAYTVYLALGEGYFNKGESEKAVVAYTKATELEPENPRAYYNLGMTQYKLNKTEEALVAFEKSIELDPQNATPYYQAGLTAIKAADYERSIAYFEKFLEIEPEAKEAAQVKAIVDELKKAIKKE